MDSVMEVLVREEQTVMDILNTTTMRRGEYLDAVLVLCLLAQTINEFKKLENDGID